MKQACRLLVALILGTLPRESHSQPSAQQDGDYADFLVTRDLVIRGTLISTTKVTHERTGGCSISKLAPIACTQFVIKADSVLFGSCPDTIVTIFSLEGLVQIKRPGAPPQPAQRFRAGQDVIAFAIRPCDDPESYWGGISPVSSGGHLLSISSKRLRLAGVPAGNDPPLQAVLRDLSIKRVHNATVSIEGARALALVRVDDVHTTSGATSYTIACHAIGTGVGNAESFPSVIRFPVLPRCNGVVVGDSLLLPIPFLGDSSVSTSTLDICPSGLVVRDGHVSGVSVTLERIGEVVLQRPSGLQILRQRRKQE